MVKLTRKGNVLLVRGIVLNHHVEKLLQSLQEIAGEHKKICVDLQELEFIDENGVRRLFETISKLQRDGYQIELVNAGEEIIFSLRKASRFHLHKEGQQRAG